MAWSLLPPLPPDLLFPALLPHEAPTPLQRDPGILTYHIPIHSYHFCSPPSALNAFMILRISLIICHNVFIQLTYNIAVSGLLFQYLYTFYLSVNLVISLITVTGLPWQLPYYLRPWWAVLLPFLLHAKDLTLRVIVHMQTAKLALSPMLPQHFIPGIIVHCFIDLDQGSLTFYFVGGPPLT